MTRRGSVCPGLMLRRSFVHGQPAADHAHARLAGPIAAAWWRRPVELARYTSQQYAALANRFGVRLSVGRTGQCWDNALAESFFATIKRELLNTTTWPTRATARTAIFDFIEGPRCPIG
ncbi:integrase core domain-containing protein [Streptomyces sp. NBC_00433]